MCTRPTETLFGKPICVHEFLVPPAWYCLEALAQAGITLPNSTTPDPDLDGAVRVAESGLDAVWNYVIRLDGEIIVAPERYGIEKHASLVAGAPVFSAGRIGAEGGTIRVVDLASGHYVSGQVIGGSSRAKDLRQFTEEVFREYEKCFQMQMLHSNFACVYR
jgi:hypothetical protein